MVRIDCLIFGYRRLRFSPIDLSTVTSILLRASIPSVINNDGTLTVRERDFAKTKDLLSGRIDFSFSEPLGLYGFWKGLSHKYALVTSIVLSVILTVFLSNLVWDIRVEGNESLTDSQVVLSLAECGFEIGDIWQTVDRAEIEAEFLKKSPDIAWININRRGTVAYVKILEKEENNLNNAEENSNEYSNIVASTDCIIEEITVKRGIAVVNVGDTVRRGDLLVIGTMPSESGDGFCNAEASVIGRINDSLSVEIPREYEKTLSVDKKLYSCTINLFKFSLNIFKKYGNLTNECVIIEDEIKYSLFDKCPLPLSVSLLYMNEKKTEGALYSDEQIVNIASNRLASLTLSLIERGDLLKIKTWGDFTDRGYMMRSDIVYLSEVGERVKLDILK